MGLLAAFGTSCIAAEPAPTVKGFLAPTPVIVLVPRVVIYAGDAIKPENLVAQNYHGPTALLLSAAVDRTELADKIARRTLLPGQLVARDAVRLPYVVFQGQPVSIVYHRDGLQILSYGVPLQSGGTGEIIALRNTQTGIVVQGRVRDGGTIIIDGPP